MGFRMALCLPALLRCFYTTQCLPCKGLCTLCPPYLGTAQPLVQPLASVWSRAKPRDFPLGCHHGSPTVLLGICDVLIREIGSGSGLGFPCSSWLLSILSGSGRMLALLGSVLAPFGGGVPVQPFLSVALPGVIFLVTAMLNPG